jgi:hypothetical protein
MSSVQKANDGIDLFDGLVRKVAGHGAHEIPFVCPGLELDLVYASIFLQLGHFKGTKVILPRPGH